LQLSSLHIPKCVQKNEFALVAPDWFHRFEKWRQVEFFLKRMPKVIAITFGNNFDSSYALEILSPYISSKKVVLLEDVIGVPEDSVLRVAERADFFKACDECEKARGLSPPSVECAVSLAHQLRLFVEESRLDPADVQRSYTSIPFLTMSLDFSICR